MKANSLGLIVIAGAIFFMFGKPQLAGLESLNLQKESYNQSIEDLTRGEEVKNALLAKLDSVPVEDLKKVDTILPEKPNIVALVSEIDSIASKRGILIRNINSGGQGNFSAGVGEVAPQRNYNSLTLTFDFDSNYENLKYFLTELESSLRLLDVRSVNFSGSDKAGMQNYKVSLDVYWAAAPAPVPENIVITP
jgi:hypothetical protein